MNLEDFKEDLGARTRSFYAKGENVGISVEMVQFLKQNSRLCLHSSAEDPFHQMLILEFAGKEFPAHRHPTKSEGYQIIEGSMELLLFNDLGRCLQVIPIDKDHPIARVGPNTFHALRFTSPYAIYLESKPGPFDRATDKIMAPWLKS